MKSRSIFQKLGFVVAAWAVVLLVALPQLRADVTVLSFNMMNAVLSGTTTVLGNITQTGNLSTSGTITLGSDLILSREAAGALQLGSDVNGAAITQTVSAADGITGTDIAGSGLMLAPGTGTGNAASGSVSLNRNLATTTGTTPQTQALAWIACSSKILSNTSATAQTIATITTSAATGGMGMMSYGTTASNGTLVDADAAVLNFAWNNNAGTVAASASTVGLAASSDASGTLDTTPTITVATNVISVKFTPTWVTIVPTVVTGYATFFVNGPNSVVCQ